MDVQLVRGLPLACAFLEVSVVPGGGGSRRNADMEASFLAKALLGEPPLAPPSPMAARVAHGIEGSIEDKDWVTRKGQQRTFHFCWD